MKQGHYFIDGPQIGVPRLHWTKAQALKAMKAIAHDKWALLFQAGMFSPEPSGLPGARQDHACRTIGELRASEAITKSDLSDFNLRGKNDDTESTHHIVEDCPIPP